MNKSRSKYLKNIKSQIPWCGSARKKFLKLIGTDVDLFLADNPQAALEELEKEFGEPKELAENFISDIGLKNLQRSAKVATVVKIATIIIVVFIIGYYVLVFSRRIDEVELNMAKESLNRIFV